MAYTYKNTPYQYGLVTKILHAIISFLFIIQFIIIYTREFILDDKNFKIFLILLHKSLGFTLLILGIIFIVWRFLNIKPKLPPSIARWEAILAYVNHVFLYLVILIMPLSGVIMSMASGKGLKWFGLSIPNVISEDNHLSEFAYNTHVYVSYLVIALVTLHLLGALKHYLVDKYSHNPSSKNNILQRMWGK